MDRSRFGNGLNGLCPPQASAVFSEQVLQRRAVQQRFRQQLLEPGFSSSSAFMSGPGSPIDREKLPKIPLVWFGQT
jgi:hypothetical protein